MEVNRSIELCRRVVTTSSLIDEAMAIYGDKYTYGKLNYINLHHKVVITCPKHGDFKEYARRFLDGDECPRCRKEEHFIKRLEAKFGDRFGLGELNYVSSTKPVTLICPKHGRFSRLIGSILASSCGCQECGNEKLQNICDKAHQDAVERKDKRIVRRVRCHSFDECLEAAMKCTRRSEFQRRYYKLYSYARSHGWLDKCCQHMGKSYDIFSPRCIYAYEFNIGGERYAYVGLTMDKNARRSEHHRRKGSSVYKFCKEHGIESYEPKYLEDDIRDENLAAERESFWADYYKNNGWIMLNQCKCGSLGTGRHIPKSYDIDKIKRSMEGYRTVSDWRTHNERYFNYLKRENIDPYSLHRFNRRIKKYGAKVRTGPLPLFPGL